MDDKLIEKVYNLLETYGIDTFITINRYRKKQLSINQIKILETLFNRHEMSDRKKEMTIKFCALGIMTATINRALHASKTDDIFSLALNYYLKGLPLYPIIEFMKESENDEEFYLKIKTLEDSNTPQHWMYHAARIKKTK